VRDKAAEYKQTERDMDFQTLAIQNRSYRRFREDESLPRETVLKWVECARYGASGSNIQPLKYIISAGPEMNGKIFPSLAWAGRLQEWPGPAQGERPTAYVVILLDTDIAKSAGVDHGIAAQNILLAAREQGYGGCMLGAIQREKLREDLALPKRYQILLVVALGKPKETVLLEKAGPRGNIAYYRDSEENHHVPKRPMDELVLTNW
jgi:nitroreductase